MKKLALALVVAFASRAHAETADELVKKAKAHFDVQEYTAAEADLKAAYKLDAKPQILYALAQAQRMAGECDRAIVSYQNFLRTSPPEDQAKLAQDNIDRCKAEPKLEPKLAPPPPPVAHGVTWSHNWAGHVLVIGGAVAAGAGTYFALQGQSKIDSINSAMFYDDYLARAKDADSAKSERTLGIVTAGVGGALIVAGIVTYIVRSPSEEAPTVSIGPHGELGVAWGF
jgi:tetratricopeptide (TPR) repeat protein